MTITATTRHSFFVRQRAICLNAERGPFFGKTILAETTQAAADLRLATSQYGFEPISLLFEHLPGYFCYEKNYARNPFAGVHALSHLKNSSLLKLAKDIYQHLGQSEFIFLLKRIDEDLKKEYTEYGLEDCRAVKLERIFETVLKRGPQIIKSLPPQTTIYALFSICTLLDKMGEDNREKALGLLYEIYNVFWEDYPQRLFYSHAVWAKKYQPEEFEKIYQGVDLEDTRDGWRRGIEDDIQKNTVILFRDQLAGSCASIDDLRMIKTAMIDCILSYGIVRHALYLIGPGLLREIVEIEKNGKTPVINKKLCFRGPESNQKIPKGVEQDFNGVQGVSFRDFCYHLMGTIGLKGQATNQEDGTVLVVLKGETNRINLFKEVLSPNLENRFLKATKGAFPGWRYVCIGSVTEV